jgi:hypothetical protein
MGSVWPNMPERPQYESTQRQTELRKSPSGDGNEAAISGPKRSRPEERSLALIRIARGLNAMMGRTGPVFEDRYHAHVLRTPAEVRNALRYVLGNYSSHAARRGA